MVHQVRCFKCGADEVRLIMGGRQILHARCQACHSNLLAEIMSFEQEVLDQKRQRPRRKRRTTLNTAPGIATDQLSMTADS